MADTEPAHTKAPDVLPPLRKRRLQSVNNKEFSDMGKLQDFSIIEKLGQGTFGVVQKAKSRKTGEVVALKQLINHSAKEGFPITAMREITILRQLNHKNILRISEMIYEEPKIKNPADMVTHRGCFYTVSPYMSSDLVGLLENPNVTLELSHIKCLMQQLLRGIQYIHEMKFLHRDIKAANILIDSKGVLKIADFGLARTYHGKPPQLGLGPGGGERAYTGLVVTRWYRPPELLLGERKYTTAVDLWGIGCVFAELFTNKPILVGKSDAHQAQLVFGLVGSPLNWTHASSLPNKSDFNIGLSCSRSLEARFEKIMPADGVKLLSGLLALDPYKRFNALDALKHEFFKNDPLPLKPEELPQFEESHEIDKKKFKRLKERSNSTSSQANQYNNESYYSSKSNNATSNLPKKPSFTAKDETSELPTASRPRAATYSQPTSQEKRTELSHTPTKSSTEGANATGTTANATRLEQPTVSSPLASASKQQNTPTHTSPNHGVSKLAKAATANILRASKSIANAPKGIFMDTSRRKRPISPAVRKPIKKARTSRPEEYDSDLTDLEGEIGRGEEDSFKSFLNYEDFQKDTEYRKLTNEKINFLQKDKKKPE
ncbi:Serine/threonine-protein kinase BUR1 [Scheffersomyces xylosifermentans]|uniref:Serine/threonine-protein kinase BUR1 n=1 Tax=Scheffersomyces xylosifermentans TaxID=1304137 RepID=UPI00315D191A